MPSGGSFPAAIARRRSPRSRDAALERRFADTRISKAGASRASEPDRQRVLYLPGHGGSLAHEPRVRRHRSGIHAARAAGASFRRRGDAGTAAVAASAPVALSGDRRHGGGAADRHAESRDDRRARRAVMDRRLHAGVAAAVRAVAGFDRLPFRQSSLRAWLAARALHLVRHDGAVRRLRDHAFRAAHPFRRHDGPPLGRAGRGGSGVPSRRRRPAHGSDSRTRSGHRSCARAREAARCRPSVRHAARWAWPSARSSLACCWHISARCDSSRSFRAPRSSTMVLNCAALWKQEPRNARPATAARRAPASATPGTPLLRPPAPAGGSSRPRSAPQASACRTFCLSPMAERSCIFRSARPRP